VLGIIRLRRSSRSERRGKQDIHVLVILLHRTDIVEKQAATTVQSGNLLRQAERAFGCEETLNESHRGAPEDRLSLLDQFLTQASRQVTFPAAWRANEQHIVGLFHKGSALEALNL
jgi:hypothetical protein